MMKITQQQIDAIQNYINTEQWDKAIETANQCNKINLGKYAQAIYNAYIALKFPTVYNKLKKQDTRQAINDGINAIMLKFRAA